VASGGRVSKPGYGDADALTLNAMTPSKTIRPRAEPRTSARGRALKLWVVLARAHSAIEARAREDAARHGLTLAEFGVLEALHHLGPLLLGELQTKLLVSSGGITYLVDRLEGRGLVRRRQRPEDRRAWYAELTRQGERLVARIFPGHARCIQHTMSTLTAEEQEEATRLLRTLGMRAAELGPCTISDA
jgi:MarR family 2-MHQ and catechol resistance regulon transcriptional repressor